MRFKVGDRYVIGAKSYADAIRVVKMFDAMETYSIRWIDTYAKSKGYGPDFWRHDVEIKATNIKEALEKLAKQVALGGTGTANCLVMHVSNSHATYQFTGRLSELLKKTKEQLGDSVKDMKTDATDLSGLYKNNDGDAIKVTRHGFSYDVQFGEDTISNTGWSYPRSYDSSHLQSYLRQNRLTKVSRLDYLKDSVKDVEHEADVDLDFLIKDELEAIDGYRKMIAKTSNPQLLSVLSHILDEETEHVEELRAAQAGVYEVEDD